MNLLTLTNEQTIKVSKQRNIQNLTISYEDREMLFSIKDKEKSLFEITKEIKINSFVGVIELKSGLLIEVLPNFEKEFKIFEFREKFLNMVLLNFENTNYLFSKLDLKKLPLSETIIYLFLNNLYNEFIKLNLAFNKNENLAFSIFKASLYLISQNINLSYLTKYLLDDLLNSLKDATLIHLNLELFEDENLKNSYFKPLLIQLKFIMIEYLPFANSTLNYWKITFDINSLFRDFINHLFKRNRINFVHQKVAFFDEYFVNFDFLIKEEEHISKLVEVSWEIDEKILKNIFFYMSLKDIQSYLIVPKQATNKEFITFANSKKLFFIKIDFSFSFDILMDTIFNFDTKKDELIEWFYKNKIDISSAKNLLKLDYLEIKNKNLTLIPPVILDNLIHLKKFSLIDNFNLMKLPNLLNLKELKILNICNNSSILIEIPNYIYNFYNLNELNLSKNSLTTIVILKPMQNLQKLILKDNNIESYSLKCENLKLFDISNNNLSYIFELPFNLKELNLSGNKLKSLTQTVTNLFNLTKLDVSRNDLRVLPNEIGNLENLIELNLSSNRLTELPKSIEKLLNLEYLYLSGNYFAKFPNEVIKLMMINKNLKVVIEKEEFKKSIPYYLYDRV